MEPSNIHILVLERDVDAGESVRELLTCLGYRVALASNERAGLEWIQKELFNLVLDGLDAEPETGIAFMEKCRMLSPDTEFIFLSASCPVQAAVKTLHQGALDFLVKPAGSAGLVEAVQKALAHQAVVAQNPQIRLRLRQRAEPNIFVGESRALRGISDLVTEIAPTDVTVLIQGESGTGKEIVARAIHEKSRRKAGPFVAVNCAAMPDSIIETELFGHCRGAFTGAISDRVGRFQLAQGGTLFLDEIGDLSAKGQADLLRVLEDGVIRPVGSAKTFRANVRIVAATNRNLEDYSRGGKFREDLFYRLNIVGIDLPPLRERPEDIAALVESFRKHFCTRHRRRQKKFSKEVLALFQSLPWPGNVRQLRNIVERLVVTVPSPLIEISDLPESLTQQGKADHAFALRPGMTLAQAEAELIRQTLQKVTSNRAEAAALLGISRRTLQYKLKRYRLDA